MYGFGPCTIPTTGYRYHHPEGLAKTAWCVGLPYSLCPPFISLFILFSSIQVTHFSFSFPAVQLPTLVVNMIPYSEKSWQALPNDSSYPTFSRPASSAGSAFTSSYISHSAATSRVGLLDESRPQTPRPAFSRNESTVSFSSYGGSTECPTPISPIDANLENEFRRNTDSISLYKQAYNNSFIRTYDPATYTIETLNKNDDVDLLSPWKRRLYRLSPLFTFLAVGAYFTYYAYRIHRTVYAQRSYHKVYIMAWLFIAAEGCVACMF